MGGNVTNMHKDNVTDRDGNALNLADSINARKGRQTFDPKSRTITRRRNGVITTGVLGSDGKLIPSSVKRTTELQLGKNQTGNKAVTRVRGSRDDDSTRTGETGGFAAKNSDVKNIPKPKGEKPETPPGETPPITPVTPGETPPITPGQTPEVEKPTASTGRVASHFGTEVDRDGKVIDNAWNQEREEASKAKGGIPDPDFKPQSQEKPKVEKPVTANQPTLPGMENVAKSEAPKSVEPKSVEPKSVEPVAPPSPAQVQSGEQSQADGNAEAAAHARNTASNAKARSLGAALGGNDSRTEPHNKPYTARDTQQIGPTPRVGRDSTIDPNIARDGTSVIDAPREAGGRPDWKMRMNRFLGRDAGGMERSGVTGKIDFGMERRPNEDIFRRTKRAWRRGFGRRNYVNPFNHAVGSKHNPPTDL